MHTPTTLWGGRLRSRRKLALQLSDPSRVPVRFGPSPKRLLSKFFELPEGITGEVLKISLMFIALTLNHLTGLLDNARHVFSCFVLGVLNGRCRGELRLLDSLVGLPSDFVHVLPGLVNDKRVHAGVHDVDML